MKTKFSLINHTSKLFSALENYASVYFTSLIACAQKFGIYNNADSKEYI